TVPTPKLGPVGMKRAFTGKCTPAQRLVSHRPEGAVGQVADVTELSPAIARRVFPPPGDIETAPRAVARPGSGDQDAVAAIGQQRDERMGRVAGRQFVVRL